MPKYRVLINGRNFLIPWIGPVPKCTEIHEVAFHPADSDGTTKLRWVGFYANVYVSAHSPDEAEETAVEIVRADDSIRVLVHNPPG